MENINQSKLSFADKLILNKWRSLSICLYAVLLSCNIKPTKLDIALKLAGSNKSELLKVIANYQKSPDDSLKLRAAYFLVENMPFHFSYDTSYLNKYRPVLEEIRSSRLNGLSGEAMIAKINPMMDSLTMIYPLSNTYSKSIEDINSIPSEYLINSIDQSFRSFEANPFKDRISFDDFLNYVLPYRIENGYSVEEWKRYFKITYPLHKSKHFSTVTQFSDSLLVNLKTFRLEGRIANQFPYLKFNDYLISKKARCSEKCWLNSLLLRSYGIPITTDFVPASRVHPAGHEWNVIKLKNSFHLIEPFWEDSLRDPKPFYSRQKNHPRFGPFQFPKVYRKTFKINRNELLEQTNSGEDIPPFFKNPFYIDVTSEYFKTFKLTVPLRKKIEGKKYGYVCVIGDNQKLVPVDFGIIKDNVIHFQSLGSENIYLPAYYESNTFLPLAYPALLKNNGEVLVLRPDKLRQRKIKISNLGFEWPLLKEYKDAFIGASIEGSNNQNFEPCEVIHKFKKSYDPGSYRIPLTSKTKYRYFRLSVPSSALVLNEINFFNVKNKIEKDLRGKVIFSPLRDSLIFRDIVDKNLTTRAVFQTSIYSKPEDKIWIGYDFKHPTEVSSFEFHYDFDISVKETNKYELFYWDFGWISLGEKNSVSTGSVFFNNVPENALLVIRNIRSDTYSRIFTFSEGQQHWY